MDDSIKRAMEEKRLLEFNYDGYHRIAEPHVYGILNGIEELLGSKYAAVVQVVAYLIRLSR